MASKAERQRIRDDLQKEPDAIVFREVSRMITGIKEGRIDCLEMRNIQPILRDQAIDIALELEKQLNSRMSHKSVPPKTKFRDQAATYEQVAKMYQMAHEWESSRMESSIS